jgi:hypothetical protein
MLDAEVNPSSLADGHILPETVFYVTFYEDDMSPLFQKQLNIM